MAFDVLVLDDGDVDGWVADLRAAGDVVGVVDGSSARGEPQFHDGIAGALELPDYYGRNWDALDEVLSDRSWLDGDRPHVLVLRDAVWLLDDEPQERLRILADVLGAAASGEVDPDDRSRRPPAPPLRVVLHARDDDEAAVLRRRFEAVGADLA